MEECCCSGDGLPYYNRGQSPVNMTTLLLGMLCCTSTAVASGGGMLCRLQLPSRSHVLSTDQLWVGRLQQWVTSYYIGLLTNVTLEFVRCTCVCWCIHTLQGSLLLADLPVIYHLHITGQLNRCQCIRQHVACWHLVHVCIDIGCSLTYHALIPEMPVATHVHCTA